MKQEITKREEYKKLCFQYGSSFIDQMFNGVEGFKVIRKTVTLKEINEELNNIF